MRFQFRFTIRDLLLLILAIALFLGAWSFIWESTRSNIYSPLSDNAGFFFSINLALLAMATCLARYGGPLIRSFAIGYVVFGWMFLVFMLHGGFGFETDFYRQWSLARLSIFGPMIGLICGIGTFRYLKRPDKAG